jgi:hypothetical protein
VEEIVLQNYCQRLVHSFSSRYVSRYYCEKISVKNIVIHIVHAITGKYRKISIHVLPENYSKKETVKVLKKYSYKLTVGDFCIFIEKKYCTAYYSCYIRKLP